MMMAECANDCDAMSLMEDRPEGDNIGQVLPASIGIVSNYGITGVPLCDGEELFNDGPKAETH